jgi:hypothetical protein
VVQHQQLVAVVVVVAVVVAHQQHWVSLLGLGLLVLVMQWHLV